MLPPMNTPTDTMSQPFDEASAQEVNKKASALMAQLSVSLAEKDEKDELPPQDVLSLVLKVRAPENNYALVMDECWSRVLMLNDLLGLEPIPYDSSYLDLSQGSIHVRTPANLALALTQEEDYFQSVALDANRWR